MSLLEIIPIWIREIPDHVKMQEICNEAVGIEPCPSVYVLDHLIMQEMCNEAVRRGSYILRHVSDHFRTQEMCNKAVKKAHGSWGVFLTGITTMRLLSGTMVTKERRPRKPQ